MKLTTFALYLIFSVSCAQPQIEPKSNAQTNAPIAQSELEKEAANLSKLYEDRNCEEFINIFPNTFENFDKLYGYEDGKGAHILYSKYDEHLNYFAQCSDVSNRKKLNKVIKLGINGKWEADAYSSLQEIAKTLIKKQPEEAKTVLDKLSNENAASFWYFLFDGPHPNNYKSAVKSFSELLGKQSKQSKLLLEQFQKVQKDWEEH